MGMEVADSQPDVDPNADVSAGAFPDADTTPAGGLSLLEAQYAATSTIFGSNDPVEILNALISFGGKPFAYAQMGLLESGTNLLNIIAVRDQAGVHGADFQQRLEDYPAYDMLSAVEVLEVTQASTDPLLTDQERARMLERGIEALIVIPLVVSPRMTGIVSFHNPEPITLSPEILRAMRSLGNQIAVVFENQSLLRNTAATLQEVQTLYEINRAILGAYEPLDVLRVLQNYLAQEATSLVHAVAERQVVGKSDTVILRHVISSAGEQVIRQQAAGLDAVREALGGAVTTSVVFVETVESPAQEALRDLLQMPGQVQVTQSYILMIVCESGRVEEIIGITFEQPQLFDSRMRRLYSAVADQIDIVLQNQRLLREAQTTALQLSQQVTVLQTLNQLSTGISSFQGELELLDYSVQSLVAALDVDHVRIALFEPDGETAMVTSEYPLKDTIGTEFDLREGDALSALRDAPERAVTIANPQESSVGRRLLMALQIYGRVIGVAVFDRADETREFTPDMMGTAQTMLSQIAIVLQNIRLLTDAQRRAEQLQRIALFGQSIQTTFDLATILDITLNESRQMLPFNRLSVALYDERRDQLRIVAQLEKGQITVDLAGDITLSLANTFVGRVWESEEMLVIDDTRAEQGARSVYDLTARSLMIAPIRSRGRMLGVISVSSFQPDAYSETEQAIFQQVTNQLAVAIDNAEAYQQSRRVARNEALINEIATHLQERSTIEDMLQIAMNELGQALGAKRARIRLAAQSDGEPGEVLP